MKDEKVKASVVSGTPAVAKTYELLVDWRGVLHGEIEICTVTIGGEEEWEPLRGKTSLAAGAELQSCSPQGETLLQAMLAHRYVKEVSR